MTSTLRDPDQLEAALEEVFQLLCFATEYPGAIKRNELGDTLRKTATELETQGMEGAALMIERLAAQSEET